MRRGKEIAALALAGALIGLSGAAFAADNMATTTESSKSSVTESAKTTKKAIERHGMIRGELTAVQPDSVTVKANGEKAQAFNVVLSNKTMVREGKSKKSVNDLKVGERVAVKYDHTKNGNTADSIRILREAPKAQG